MRRKKPGSRPSDAIEVDDLGALEHDDVQGAALSVCRTLDEPGARYVSKVATGAPTGRRRQLPELRASNPPAAQSLREPFQLQSQQKPVSGGAAQTC